MWLSLAVSGSRRYFNQRRRRCLSPYSGQTEQRSSIAINYYIGIHQCVWRGNWAADLPISIRFSPSSSSQRALPFVCCHGWAGTNHGESMCVTVHRWPSGHWSRGSSGRVRFVEGAHAVYVCSMLFRHDPMADHRNTLATCIEFRSSGENSLR